MAKGQERHGNVREKERGGDYCQTIISLKMDGMKIMHIYLDGL